MMTLDQRVIETALGWHHAGRAVWLCTVLQTWGSSPRAPGTMMVISDSGEGCGSLSGGCIEEDFLARLAEGHYRIHSQVVRYGEGGRQTQGKLPCGGSLDVMVEYLVADNDSGHMLQAMHQALRGKTRLLKTATVNKRAKQANYGDDGGAAGASLSASRGRVTGWCRPGIAGGRLLYRGL
ncbi:XdhC family protein [Aureimonas ureilytica]|uniref:XdhC family protein n=1 Tax=Aureimonas ureilytica TaxID=401562 RepID=UPI0019D4B22A|nr:XdhC family protein [Aureimonas ureilytica]